MLNRTTVAEKKQESHQKAEELGGLCGAYLQPLLQQMHRQLDGRLVRTLRDLVVVIISHRHRNQGLVMSELGGVLLGAEHAPAGRKRISNLLHSPRWQAQAIEEHVWRQADQKVTQLQADQIEALAIWDDSENEKPESLAAEGLCAVRSSKAARLKRIKPGYFNPPGGRPIFVPGFHWMQLIVMGMQGLPTLAHLHWWTSRGEQASDKRTEQLQVLKRAATTWGNRVVHVFDQGYAGQPWVGSLLSYPLLRFVLRWKKGYQLVGSDGQAKLAWQVLRGKPSMGHREIWDACRRCKRTTGIIFAPVHLPADPRPLWLVVSRPGSPRKPWYLLTNQPITTVEEAWHIVFTYARRWQIEMALRFQKSELAFESPRLQDWASRLKILGIASLAFAFLLLLLDLAWENLKSWLLVTWCHRNGKWSRETPAPLYRLRLALSLLWQTFRPSYLPLLNSG